MPDRAIDTASGAASVDRLELEGVCVSDLTRDELFGRLRDALERRTQLCLGFCNANMLLKALCMPAYAAALRGLLLVSDGIGIDLCSGLFRGRFFRQNLNGTDLVPAFLSAETAPRTLYLLGAKPGIAAAAARNIALLTPQHRVVGVRHGYFSAEETGAVIAEINAASPDILLVALGNPAQEMFIAENAHRIDARLLMGIGALLDYTAGAAIRAPVAFRLVRLEWLFRLLREPRRLGRRYTVDIVAFAVMILRLRLASLARSRPIRAADAR
ncbi:WecB/TagA/CpsF family glycosyltransferase [Methylobacterium nonmethylotrophicum]|uniref:WecB/TagA/CpsF family glycosyltransferase n=1 Tax=Methylobacterium nonmethylotrophicum TaxID=1141884 RepID=A0A4Z0NWI5_9HYPH|nr:WecB/TagA/CpsF family glycosyltransferase [Methylobacterium nonmethylotrophicum]TGE00813.1 WecB/TagA/CpsF family glycosyltransferase [Methylobacterium nonmethylotrophicum]